MDYTTNADGYLTAASLTVVETTLTLVLTETGIDIALRDRDAVVRVSLRPDEVEEAANVLTDFLAALDAKAGRA